MAPPNEAYFISMSNGGISTADVSNIFGGWAVHDGDVNPVSIVDVTYDSPVIDFGPLSFGLAELPAEPEVTFLLNDGTPAGGGATSYGLGNVLSANLIFGDVIGPNYLTAFAMEVLANGSIDTLSYTFSPIDTPSVSGGGIVMNSPLFISGTDIASGQAFSYTYANSVETISPAPGPGDFNGDLLVNGADFLKWQQGFGDTYDASHLTEWEENFGEVPGPMVAAIVSTPEPSTLLLSCLAGVLYCSHRRRV